MTDLTMTLNGIQVVRPIPTKWSEVEFGKFLGLADASDDASILAVLTGEPRDIVRKARINNLDTMLALLAFLRTAADTSVLPETILGYHVPKDLAFETIAQYEDLKDDLKTDRQGIDQLRRYTLYCAIYACSQKHGEYDWKKAEAMADEFLLAPAPEVLAIGNFTLGKLIALKNGTDPASLMQEVRQRKNKRAFSGWRRVSDSILRFFTLRLTRRTSATSS